MSPQEDLDALDPVTRACKEEGRRLAERELPPAAVEGIQPIGAQLRDIVSAAQAQEALDVPAAPTDITVAAAFKFANARRAAIGRVAKGPRNRNLRHAFGISLPMRPDGVEEVRDVCVALLAGRSANPETLAARLITAADVKKLKGFVAQLDEIKRRAGVRRSSDAKVSRTRDVLHAAIELFYDRFAAAVELAFEDDDAGRVALLSLVPRRKEQRRAQAAPTPLPVPAPAPVPTVAQAHAATD